MSVRTSEKPECCSSHLHRQRKVRCNVQRPRCAHCERLNLECKWKAPSLTSRNPTPQPIPNTRALESVTRTATNPWSPSSSSVAHTTPVADADGIFKDVFDYASFMWDFHDTESIQFAGPSMVGRESQTNLSYISVIHTLSAN